MKYISFLSLLGVMIMSTAHARVLYTTEELDGIEATTFTINRENLSNTTQLIFGDSLNASISFDSNTNRFTISQSVDFAGNETKNLVLEQGNTFPNSPTLGQVFYRSDLDQTFVYNGTTWSNGYSGSSNTTQFTATIPNGTSQTFTHSSDPNFERVMEVLSFETEEALASPTWSVYDPNNYSNLDNNIKDGNFGTIWYNNTSPNPNNKWIGFNAGSTTNINKFTVYDYASSNTFRCNNMRFQSSNNGSSWTTNMTISGHTYSPNGVTYTLPSMASGQYFRLQCTGPVNATWWVLSELEIFEITGAPRWVRSQDITLELNNATQTTIRNTGTDRDFRINIILP